MESILNMLKPIYCTENGFLVNFFENTNQPFQMVMAWTTFSLDNRAFLLVAQNKDHFSSSTFDAFTQKDSQLT
jgi:hypothetical protein